MHDISVKSEALRQLVQEAHGNGGSGGTIEGAWGLGGGGGMADTGVWGADKKCCQADGDDLGH